MRTLRATCLIVSVLLSGQLAFAHDWYVGKRDPITGGGCCTTTNKDGYGDCAQLVIEPGVLTAEPGGFRLRLTEAQARRINPLRVGPVDTFVPEDRIQQSGDGNWHVCIPSRAVSHMQADFFCFFQPGAS